MQEDKLIRLRELLKRDIPTWKALADEAQKYLDPSDDPKLSYTLSMLRIRTAQLNLVEEIIKSGGIENFLKTQAQPINFPHW